MGFKDKLLSYSNQFNYYKENYQKLLKENKSLKKKMKKLKKENGNLTNEFELIKQLIINKDNISLDSNYCPCCGRVSNFRPFGVKKREKALCPHCKSLERHRFVYLIFEKMFSDEIKNKNIKLLHFAPEILFYKYFSKFDNIDYYPVDLYPETYEKRGIKIKDKVNMEEIPYGDEEFDFIYNSHVLEHVPDDIKAMGELYRVLKKDGVCIVIIPFVNEEKTLEKEEYNTPELRLKHYGLESHVRLYGLDFKERIESVGFNVETLSWKDLNLSEKEIQLFNIKKDSVMFVCRK